MKFQEVFRYLKVDEMNRKDNGNAFMVLHVLDPDSNPSRFFIFNTDIMNKFRSMNPSNLQELVIDFNVISNDKGWNVSLLDIN